MKTCSVNQCERKHNSKGFCELHYYRFKKYGDPLKTSIIKVCKIDRCDKKHAGHGFCSKHLNAYNKKNAIPIDNEIMKSFLYSKITVNIKTNCHEWILGKNRGYGCFKKNGIVYAAHRVSYEVHNNVIPDGMFVCHHCDNPKCINPEHLFLGTNQDNMIDMRKKGRGNTNWIKSGEEQYASKLKDEDIKTIRKMINDGVFLKVIAKKFNVCLMTISNIKRNKIWRHVA